MRRFIVLFVVLLTPGLLGCDEPIDCGDGPGKCLKAAKRPAATARGVAIPQPVDRKGNQPVLRHVDPPKDTKAAKENRPAVLGQRQIDPTQGAGRPLNGVPTGRPTADFEAHAGIVHTSRRTPADLIRRIMNVTANRNVAGLKRFCTPKLAANIDEMTAKHADRFWKHLDKYVDAANNGFSFGQPPHKETSPQSLTIKAKSGAVLNPVVIKDDKGWLFDRF